jgi:hypothetical protein
MPFRAPTIEENKNGLMGPAFKARNPRFKMNLHM